MKQKTKSKDIKERQTKTFTYFSLDDLKDGIKPGQNVVYNSSPSSNQYDTMQYNADMQKFRKAVFSNSEEFGTSSGSSGEVSHKQQRL